MKNSRETLEVAQADMRFSRGFVEVTRRITFFWTAVLGGTKARRHAGTKGLRSRGGRFGEGDAVGGAGGEVEGEEGFADADDEGDFAAGDAVGPEALGGFGVDEVVSDGGSGGGHGGLLMGEGRVVNLVKNRRGTGVGPDPRRVS